MSDYSQITDFSAKDALASGDPEKVATGADVDAELAAISAAIATKANDSAVVHVAGTETINGAKTFSTDVTVQSTDAGAGAGPNLILDRNSASPAAADNMAEVLFRGRDSGGNVTEYASVYGSIVDPTNGSEDGKLHVQTIVAGNKSDRIYVQHGVVVGAATGGDQGAGTINAVGVYDDGGLVYSAANPVPQAGLKTTTASGSTGVGAGSSASHTLTGGTYSWWTISANSQNATDNWIGLGNGDVAAGIIGLMNRDGTSTRTAFVDERYVQASPPYRYPFFAYLALDASKNVVHSSFATDPPYAYHGPVDITPQYVRAGKLYRRVKKADGVPLHNLFKQPHVVERLLLGDAEITEDEVEITVDYKESNLVDFPHPFTGADTSGLTIVQLQMPDALAGFFMEACDSGVANEIRKLVLAGKLIVDNEPLDVPNAAPGVMAVRAHWKKAK